MHLAVSLGNTLASTIMLNIFNNKLSSAGVNLVHGRIILCIQFLGYIEIAAQRTRIHSTESERWHCRGVLRHLVIYVAWCDCSLFPRQCQHSEKVSRSR